MKVLVACEYSGIVREAFAAKGHDAWSCDILPSEQPGNHIQGDVLEVLNRDWDLMIAHPPCTYLASSGARWFSEPGRKEKQRKAIEFFMKVANAPIYHIALENPVGVMSTIWRKPQQIIQPYQFGDDASKKTCLWLKNLPTLKATKIIPPGENGYWSNQTPSGQNKLGPSEHRASERSRTYRGFAEAMADQWSNI